MLFEEETIKNWHNSDEESDEENTEESGGFDFDLGEEETNGDEEYENEIEE